MRSWVTFDFCGHTKSGKTGMWEVVAKEGCDVLGYVKWFGRWRRYAFFPSPKTVFEENCLRDIANFCDARTAQHQQRLALGGAP